MAVKRSVEGLRRNAQKKKQETLEKAKKGIQSLVKDKRPINFNTVAEASGVSKAWLYRETDIKDQIKQLRAQSSGSKKQLPANQQASDATKDAWIKKLRDSNKRLQAENKDLRRQNEVNGGYFLKARELEKEVQRLNAHVERLQQKMNSNSAHATPPESKSIQLALADQGVEMNSTLARLITETPAGILETALEALREGQAKGSIKNPGGFFHSAVRECWKPNEAYKENAGIEEFNAWWQWAHGEGLVIGSTQIDGILHVYTKDNKCRPFLEMAATHPIPQ